MPIPLIDKKDNFELVRDEIAAILAKETLNQQALASAAAKDPKLWQFDVFIERSRIWESLQADELPVVPRVNIWFDSDNFDSSQSFSSLLHTADPGIFNIDIFTAAVNEKNVGDGYISADRQVVLDCQRIVRLVRNILFSVPPDTSQPGEDYPFLNMRGVVGYRKIQSRTLFQPSVENQAIAIGNARIALAVKYIETALEGPSENFELLQASTATTDGGQMIYQFDLA